MPESCITEDYNEEDRMIKILIYLNLDMKASTGFLTMEIQVVMEQLLEKERKWT